MTILEMIQSNDPKIHRLMRIRRFGVQNGVEDGLLVADRPLEVENDVENDKEDSECNGDSEALPVVSKEALDEELDRIEAERNEVLKNKPQAPIFPYRFSKISTPSLFRFHS